MFGEVSLFDLIGDERVANLLYLFLVFFFVGAGAALEKREFGRSSPNGDTRIVRGAFDPHVLLLIAVLALGIALRFFSLSWGLPLPFHPDEFEEAGYLQGMMRHSTINPHYAQQPPLILYLSWPVSIILNLLSIFDESTIVRNVFAGRIVNAAAGSVSILLVYLLGTRLFSRFTGLAAAILLAASPLHVTNSRYMKQDALLVMFVLACALAVAKCIDTKKIRFLFLAGIYAGLAAGSKYTGLACAGILLSAAWLNSGQLSLRPDKRVFTYSVAACGIMAVSFFLSMPYVLFSFENLDDLRNGMAFESWHARTGHNGLAIDPWNQLWMFHFSRSLIPGLHFLPIAAALLAAGMFIVRGQTKGLWVLGIILMFYIPAEWARSKPPPQPDRYVLSCVPFVALLAAEFLSSMRSRFSNSVLVAATALLVFFPLGRSFQLASELKYDTRNQMTDWLASNLPPGAKILKTGGAAYLPRIPLKFKSVSARKVISRDKSNIVQELRDSHFDYLLTTSISTGRFSVENLPEGNSRPLRVRQAMRTIEQNFQVVKKIAPQSGSYGFHNPTITLYALKSG